MNGLQEFAVGLVTICVFLMRGVGVIDDQFSGLMRAMGVVDPGWQLAILLGLMVFYVVLSLRAVGGMLGWVMLLFGVLLLLHRTVPGSSSPTMPIAAQLQNAL